MYYVYIIKSIRNGRHYIGFTQDLEDRLKQHNAGRVRSTKAFVPYKIIYKETFLTYTEARKRELSLKKRKSSKYFKELI